MQTQEALAIFSEWAKTWEFYKSGRTLLPRDDNVAVAVCAFVCQSDPLDIQNMENRSLALKILDRIDFHEVPRPVCEHLFQIARHDRMMNAILVIKCFESFSKRSLIDASAMTTLIDCLVFSAQRVLKSLHLDMKVLLDMLFFTFEFSRNTGVSTPLLQSLVEDVEAAANHFLRLRITSKWEQNQANYTLYKLLVFFMSIGGSSVIERIAAYLIANVGDDSKELCFGTYDKISSLAERNVSLLKKNFHFFIQSRFLDVRAVGIKSILRALKHKTGLKRFREEILGTIHTSVQGALRVSDYKVLCSFLELLYILNKQYASDTSALGEKHEFRRCTIVIVRETLDVLGRCEGVEMHESIKAVLSIVISLIEDSIALFHGLAEFKPDISTFSPNTFRTEEMRLLDPIFAASLHVFKHKVYVGLLERFYKLFLYSDLRYFSLLMKKYASTILDLTRRHEVLLDMWSFYLESEKCAFLFGVHLYGKIVDCIHAACDWVTEVEHTAARKDDCVEAIAPRVERKPRCHQAALQRHKAILQQPHNNPKGHLRENRSVS
jgi:hypothetical protein